MLVKGDIFAHDQLVGRHRAAIATVEFRRRRWRKMITTGLEGACGDRAARVLSAALIFRGKPDFPSEREDLESFLRTELMAAAAAVIGHERATYLIAELSSSIDNATGVARISLTQKRVRSSQPPSDGAATDGVREIPTAEQYVGFVEKTASQPSSRPSMGSLPSGRQSLRQVRDARRNAQRRPVLILSASSYAARAVTLEHGSRVEVIHHDDPVLFESEYQALLPRNPVVLLDGRGRFREFCHRFAKRCDPFTRCVLWGFGSEEDEFGENMIPSVSSLTPEDLSMIVGRFLQTRG